MGKIPPFVTRGKPLVTHEEFYFSPLVASPLMGKNPILSSYPSFNSSFHHVMFYIYYKEKGLDIVKALHIAVLKLQTRTYEKWASNL